jgi:hypothetical protein
MGRVSPFASSRLAGAIAITFGLYAGVGLCFAAALYWLMQPSVIDNPGMAAYRYEGGMLRLLAKHAILARDLGTRNESIDMPPNDLITCARFCLKLVAFEKFYLAPMGVNEASGLKLRCNLRDG